GERCGGVPGKSGRRPGLNILDGPRQVAENDLHLTADEISECRSAATIGHVNDIDARHHLEQLAGNMERGAVTARRKIDLAGISLRISDEFGNGLYWQRRRDDHDEWHAYDAGDRHDVTEEIEIQLVV